MSDTAAKSRLASGFLFENGSLVVFQAGYERQGCKIARRIQVHLLAKLRVNALESSDLAIY